LRAVVIGAVESTFVAAQAIGAAPDWSLCAIFTLESRLASRHSDFHDLAPAADAAGAELVPVERIETPQNLAKIAGLQPDYVFVIGWSQICQQETMNTAPGRFIGYHPTALPRMRGRAAIPWTILNKEPITAGTLFWMDDGVDTGAVLDQEFFHVSATETAASLYEKHMEALRRMLHRTLTALAEGRIRRDVQEEQNATWIARRRDADGAIDWHKPAAEIERLVRAVGRPYPGAFTRLEHDRLTIWSAHLSSVGERCSAVPGQVIDVSDAAFTVACAGGTSLTITSWDHPLHKRPSLHCVLGRAA
jgi:methionyl-tRNA formyltransferase